ncbi:MAG TPA: phosphoribosylformylglycinamidine synthase subunit PurS [Candidatus Dormibacteraeota bacterium]|nr:phosphoribosylformylglycinamidine synthase subunit PurS [Candidatus Dormibacteraeota bacterium]
MRLLARVTVLPKPLINDPQGVTVRQGLHHLGFDEVEDCRVGKYIELTLDSESESSGRNRVMEMCQRLLANGVIEDYALEVSALQEAPR